MKILRYYAFLFGGVSGLVLLFLLNFVYIFLALGIFSLGLIAFPASLLGIVGFIHITTDVPMPSLILFGGGFILLGAGMCLGMIPLCSASMEKFRRFRKDAENRKRRLGDA